MDCRWVMMMKACGIARRKGAENGRERHGNKEVFGDVCNDEE